MSLPAFFKTIAKESTGEFKDKGSKFIAYAFPIHNESDCKQRIQQLRKEHHTAAHVCWAYVMGLSSEIVSILLRINLNGFGGNMPFRIFSALTLLRSISILLYSS
jgi:putative IMPACT (imprinted ancient) family translation regulator